MFGGIRRNQTIANELTANLSFLKKDGWKVLKEELANLYGKTSREVERSVADHLDDNLQGLGPKQARNVLQALGLTRYEIPIDSRITKWLNKLPFPVKLGAAALSDRNYYQFVMDGIEVLCEESGVYPCILDASIFVSFDGEGWTPQNVVW